MNEIHKIRVHIYSALWIFLCEYLHIERDVGVFILIFAFQEKVYEEITRIFEGSDRPPNKEDLEEMKYLERVIKESMRLYPSVSAMGRVTETDVQIGEFKERRF